MDQNAPFPGQRSLFSLFARRVVAALKPAVAGTWRGLLVVNHIHRNAGYVYAITLIGTKNDSVIIREQRTG
jgi:hypothetical protein